MMFLVALVSIGLLVTSECRMSGGGGRGSSYRPTSSSWPSSPSRPRPQSSPSSSTGYGWRAPSQQQPTYKPASIPTAVEKYGTQPKTGQARPYPTSAPTHGWQASKPNVPHPTSAPSYGWKATTPRPNTATNNYGWRAPNQNAVTQKPPSFHQAVNQARTQQRPTQNQYNTGKKYEKGYSKGYDQGYQRGVQQATRINPTYYPQQSHFGYPGQGINAGYGSPTYGGMSIYGTPNNYGYPVSSAYGYQTYGSGNHDFRNGLILGAVGGYLLNSALHPSRHTTLYHPQHFSSPWGYDGAGYGSRYEYRRTEANTNTVINNYYFNNTQEDKDGKMPEEWIQCVAYDPMTASTFTNPNCSCTISVEKDAQTNSSIASHNCDTIWGHKVEQKTPINDVQLFEAEFATNKSATPAKLQEISDAMRRMEAYRQLEKLVNMGRFSV